MTINFRIKKWTILILLFLYNLNLQGQEISIYSKVEIISTNPNLVQSLNENGFAIDHFQVTDQSIIVPIKNTLVEKLIDLNIPYKVLVNDLAADYEKRKDQLQIDNRNSSIEFDNFDLGSMGDYHTFDEMVTSINLMKTLFPDKVKLMEIGQTYEGRTIHAIKISDNVEVDESDSEGVAYFDALTHAREPNGMFCTLYFMWYLLENHETNNEMMYLMNNRELYFVPVVNPDGYVYNQTTNPNGGGFWRKNRAANTGSSCIGTDLNRNYGVLWGQAAGTNPCADDYRGASAFSELESQAVRGLVDKIVPKTALSNHAFSDLIITAKAGTSLIGDNIHREYGGELCPHDYDGYGQVGDILGASGTGATIEYIAGTHECVAYTPEIGTFFWESSANLIWQNAETLFPIYKFLAYTAGEYSSFHDFQLIKPEPIVNGFSNSIEVRLFNKGQSFTANDVSAVISCDHPAIELTNNTSNYANIASRAFETNSATPFDFNIIDELMPNEAIEFKLDVFQNGGFAYRDSFFIYAGDFNTLFSENAESSLDNWDTNSWQITDVESYEGQFCISDSPESNYSGNANKSIEMNISLDLSLTQNPYLLFDARWSLQPNSDFVRVKISTNEGNSWSNISGASYTGSVYWQQQKIDLSNYANEDNVRIGFFLTSDFMRQSDGFYFDNLSIVDVLDPNITSLNDLEETSDLEFKLYPNPVDNYVYIEFTDSEFSNYDIECLDVNSRLIFRKSEINSRLKRIDTSELLPGIYYIQIIKDSKRTSLEFIKN